MSKVDEKNVAIAICTLTKKYDCQNVQNVKDILDKVENNKLFQQSTFGMRYINRLSFLLADAAPSDCIFCGKHADNQVVCNSCMNVVGPYADKLQKQNNLPRPDTKTAVNNTRNSSVSIEDLFKDMDDSLMQLASQSTVGTIKRLSWINITLTIINSIVIFFLALFLWKFITAQ